MKSCTRKLPICATFTGWFSTIVGLFMLSMWAFFLAAGQVPELQTAPFEIAFHLAAEFATALALVVGGLAIVSGRSWGRLISLAALGMLIYSVVVSPGYYAQLGNWLFVAMFALLLVLALMAVGNLVRFKEV
jgi:peptidoglycan/LPS O-acetylase OafA/YrhL